MIEVSFSKEDLEFLEDRLRRDVLWTNSDMGGELQKLEKLHAIVLAVKEKFELNEKDPSVSKEMYTEAKLL